MPDHLSTEEWQQRAIEAGYPPDDIRFRDGWRCTATVEPREIKPGVFLPREARPCSITGSEMVAFEGRTYCPKHAYETFGEDWIERSVNRDG